MFVGSIWPWLKNFLIQNFSPKIRKAVLAHRNDNFDIDHRNHDERNDRLGDHVAEQIIPSTVHFACSQFWNHLLKNVQFTEHWWVVQFIFPKSYQIVQNWRYHDHQLQEFGTALNFCIFLVFFKNKFFQKLPHVKRILMLNGWQTA